MLSILITDANKSRALFLIRIIHVTDPRTNNEGRGETFLKIKRFSFYSLQCPYLWRYRPEKQDWWCKCRLSEKLWMLKNDKREATRFRRLLILSLKLSQFNKQAPSILESRHTTRESETTSGITRTSNKISRHHSNSYISKKARNTHFAYLYAKRLFQKDTYLQHLIGTSSSHVLLTLKIKLIKKGAWHPRPDKNKDTHS